MPIELPFEPAEINRSAYHDFDKKVMKLAYSIHNEIGRCFHEEIFKKALCSLCKSSFDHIQVEVPFYVKYKNFSKQYRIDLLLNNSIIYELKAVEALNHKHEAQTLNYLYLTNLQWGKLINFRPTSVEDRYVTTTIEAKDRFKFSTKFINWDEDCSVSLYFSELMQELLHEWGAYLQPNLFKEAVTFFSGGEDEVIFPVDIYFKKDVIGSQKMRLLNDKTAFSITAFRDEIQNHRIHLQRLLNTTCLEKMLWVNLNRQDITFEAFYRSTE